MVHLERETYQRTESSRHYRLTGSTFTVLREGPPITLDIEDFEERYKCGHCGHEWTGYSLEIHRELPAKPRKADGAKRLRPLIAVLIVCLVATVSVLGSAYAFHWFGNGPLNCANQTVNDPHYSRFTVVMSESGYNDSRDKNPPPSNYLGSYRPPPWPIMNTTIGMNVIIHVLNNDTLNIYGFAIAHYFEQGVVLQPGGSCYLIFLASTSGAFTVWDNTSRDSRGFYEYAQLNVNP